MTTETTPEIEYALWREWLRRQESEEMRRSDDDDDWEENHPSEQAVS